MTVPGSVWSGEWGVGSGETTVFSSPRSPLPTSQSRFNQLRQPEIEHLNYAVAAQHDVFGLDVPMDDPGLVRRRERRGDLDGDVERGYHRHLPVGQNFSQRQPFDEFGGDEMRRAVIADLVNGDDVRVVERAGRARLLLESEQPLVVPRSFVEQ